jgi:hypothetical protein
MIVLSASAAVAAASGVAVAVGVAAEQAATSRLSATRVTSKFCFMMVYLRNIFLFSIIHFLRKTSLA